MAHRVVVTGVGAVCALGNSRRIFTEAFSRPPGIRICPSELAGSPMAAACSPFEAEHSSYRKPNEPRSIQ